MNVSRIIIEQRLSDLEIALNRQEELIKTQKDTLRNLRELVTLIASESPTIVELAAPLRPIAAPVVPPAAPQVVRANRSSQVQSSNVGPILAPPPPPKRDHQLLHAAGLLDSVAPASKKPKIESIITTSYPKRRRALDKVRQISGLFAPLVGREVGAKATSATYIEPLISLEPLSFNVTASSRSGGSAINSFVSLARPAPVSVSSSSSGGNQPRLQPGSAFLVELRALKTVHQRVLALRTLEGRLQATNAPLATFFNSGGKALLITWLVNLENLPSPSADAAELIDSVLKLFNKIEFTKAEITSNRIDRVLRKLYKKFSPHSEFFRESLLELMRTTWAKYRALFKDGNGDDDGEAL